MSYTISTIFGTPMKECPDGTPLEGKTFKNKEEAMDFYKKHSEKKVVEMRPIDSITK